MTSEEHDDILLGELIDDEQDVVPELRYLSDSEVRGGIDDPELCGYRCPHAAVCHGRHVEPDAHLFSCDVCTPPDQRPSASFLRRLSGD